MINEDDVTKDEIAEYIAKKLYPDYGEQYFENDTRPINKNSWIIEGIKHSDNPNHPQVVDDNGEVIGNYEEYSTYTNKGKEQAQKIYDAMKSAGYRIKRFVDVGKSIKEGDYFKKLTPQELANLANAGQIGRASCRERV